jgi:hypothetical protein
MNIMFSPVRPTWCGGNLGGTERGDSQWPKKKTITIERNVRFEDGTVFGEETPEEI